MELVVTLPTAVQNGHGPCVKDCHAGIDLSSVTLLSHWNCTATCFCFCTMRTTLSRRSGDSTAPHPTQFPNEAGCSVIISVSWTLFVPRFFLPLWLVALPVFTFPFSFFCPLLSFLALLSSSPFCFFRLLLVFFLGRGLLHGIVFYQPQTVCKQKRILQPLH